MSDTTVTVTKSSELEPAGVAGYAKGIAALIAGVLSVLVQFVAEGEARTVLTAIIAVAGFIAVYQFPFLFKPITVAVPPTPEANLDVEDDTPGDHALDNPDRLRKQ